MRSLGVRDGPGVLWQVGGVRIMPQLIDYPEMEHWVGLQVTDTRETANIVPRVTQ